MSEIPTFGKRLRRLRRDRGLSILAVETAAGISGSTLRRWEADRFQPRLPELGQVLRALDATDLEASSLVALIHAPRAVRAVQ